VTVLKFAPIYSTIPAPNVSQREMNMKIKAVFVKDGDWWVAWTDDVPGAMTQGRTIEEVRENLIDAINEIQKPVDLSQLPNKEVFTETMEI
jgi:predicted RNase H-like HicB family nuclease